MFQTTNQLCVNPRLNPDFWGVFNICMVTLLKPDSVPFRIIKYGWEISELNRGFIAEIIIIKLYQPRYFPAMRLIPTEYPHIIFHILSH